MGACTFLLILIVRPQSIKLCCNPIRLLNRSKTECFTIMLKPQNTSYKSTADALASFREAREKLIQYVNTTDADLRNHVVTFPAGSYDAYQMILFIGAHSNRHTQQMEEVKADPNFPKN